MAAYAENRKAFHDYEVLEKMSAGILLSGSEVKSIRAGKISLSGSFVTVRGGEAYLMGANIDPYQPRNQIEGYDPGAPRKLLLSKKELEILAETENTKGLTIVPLSVYNKKRFIKIDIAIAR